MSNDESPGAEPFRPLHRRARWAIALLLAGVVVDLVAVASGLAERGLLDKIESGGLVADSEADANDRRQLVVGLVQGAVFVATAAVFLFWFHRAYRNLLAFGVSPKYGPGWAVGGWFVPILNLWRPKEIVNEIWRQSPPVRVDDPVRLEQARRVPRFLLLWWLAYLVSNWLYWIASRLSLSAEELPQLRTANGLFLAADAVGVLAGLLAVLVVQRVTARETARAQHLGVSPREDPTPGWRRPTVWAAAALSLAAIAAQSLVALALWRGALGDDADAGPVAPPGAPADAIFADDFSRRDVWLVEDARSYRFDYGEGRYRVLIREEGLWSSIRTLPDEVDSLQIDVDVRLHAGEPVDDFYGVSCTSSSNGSYLFGISPDGYRTIAFDPGGDQTIDLERLSEETGRPFEPAGSTDHLRVTCDRRGNLSLSVNGTLLEEATHEQPLGTFVGVELFAYSEAGGTEVHFDNVIVRRTSG